MNVDTSALIKLVLPEEGSALALELWNGDLRAAASVLVYPEGRVALAAAERSQRLTGRRHREAVKNFDRAYEEIARIGVLPFGSPIATSPSSAGIRISVELASKQAWSSWVNSP